MNPIDALFTRLRAAKRPAFMPFLTAGDPDLAFTAEALPSLAAAGADLVEVGFPFSDPIADGPVIQASYTRALSAGFKLGELFKTVKTVTSTSGWTTPLVAMASYSLIWKKGIVAFIETAQQSGFNGAVVPDLPAEEADEIATRCRDRDFKLILLVSPTTAPARAEKIVKACSGFVYVVSVVGITGTQTSVAGQVEALLARLRKITDLPLCVGFGVSKPEHVKALKDIADGVIVGSALVKKLDRATADRARAMKDVSELVRQLRGAID